jgi:hypothetical protein
VSRVGRSVDEPENQGRQHHDKKQRQSGKKPDLFLVRGGCSFTPMTSLAEHTKILWQTGAICNPVFT